MEQSYACTFKYSQILDVPIGRRLHSVAHEIRALFHELLLVLVTVTVNLWFSNEAANGLWDAKISVACMYTRVYWVLDLSSSFKKQGPDFMWEYIPD